MPSGSLKDPLLPVVVTIVFNFFEKSPQTLGALPKTLVHLAAKFLSEMSLSAFLTVQSLPIPNFDFEGERPSVGQSTDFTLKFSNPGKAEPPSFETSKAV